MRLNVSFGRVLALACAAAMWSCGEGRSSVSPVSPSSLTPLTAPRSSLRLGPLNYDYHSPDDPGPVPTPDPGPVPTPDPGPVPTPDPGPVPTPDPEPVPTPDPEPVPTPDPEPVPTPDPGPVPTSDPGPVPVALTVSIVGSSGNNAFTPNPIQASVGDLIVWMNSDKTMHRIVLDDGTVIGDVAPGESSVPMPLTNPKATYHCTIHPTMVGGINDAAPAPPTSPDSSPDPSPPDDDYYLRFFR